jgi:hypothetical protein
MECGDLSPLLVQWLRHYDSTNDSSSSMQHLNQKRRQVAALHTEPVGMIPPVDSGTSERIKAMALIDNPGCKIVRPGLE